LAADLILPPTFSIANALSGETIPVSWLVPDFIPFGSIIALAGEPGAGKSYLAYSLSLALATGTPFLGFELSPHRVLYFDQENSEADCTQYLRWAWNGLGCPRINDLIENFHLAPFVLGSASWAVRAREYTIAYKPSLIVIDTTTPALAIEDENDNAEASKAVQLLRGIQRTITPSPAVIVLKHAKVRSDDGAYTLRGAKTWEGAVDSVVFQIRRRGKPREDGLRPTHLEPSKTRAFGLRESINIEPRWTDSAKTGLKLERRG
jgi:RecA-family ATPase